MLLWLLYASLVGIGYLVSCYNTFFFVTSLVDIVHLMCDTLC
jgi:hypothetical protein